VGHVLQRLNSRSGRCLEPLSERYICRSVDSGDGIAADANGNYYLASGNGSYSGSTSDNYGDSILRLGSASSGTLPVLDSFTPWNQNSLSGEDSDVGSGESCCCQTSPRSAASALLVQMGKEGTIYLVDRAAMGGYCSTCVDTDTQIVQEINNAASEFGLTGILERQCLLEQQLQRHYHE